MTLDRKDGHWTWTTLPALLTGGTPQIVQTPPDATGKATDGGYSYYGFGAQRRDRAGRITAFKLWPVLCGPPPPTAKAGDNGAAPATHPFPGLTMDANDSDCTTASREAVRNAADASRLWADATLTAHWVRAGDR